MVYKKLQIKLDSNQLTIWLKLIVQIQIFWKQTQQDR